MPGSELSRLNADSFERLVRALALKLMGPGGTVYPAGPDGGRDFTYEGAIRGYEGQGWDGYLVIQAKFRATSGGSDPADSGSDPTWLSAQIAAEKAQYDDPQSGRRRPDYYIVATNVSLSGADGRGVRGISRTGGLTKIREDLERWRISPGLCDFDIWAADKIVDLLADAPDVRQTFAAWVMPGDVLAAMARRLDAIVPDFGGTLRRAMRKALARDLHARLRDAGSSASEDIRIGQVFIDLPLGTAVARHPPEISRALPTAGNRVLQRLVERSRGKLDEGPTTSLAGDGAARVQVAHRNRVLLLGGPGQGKSTAATFAAQVFRASFLIEDAGGSQKVGPKSHAEEILERARTEGVNGLPPRRFPVLIALNRFADEMSIAREAEATVPTLLAEMARSLSRDADTARLDQDHLRAWLRVHPWLLILDGLDEVPASGERGAVLLAIDEFEREIGDVGADVLMLVTTRPQGYNHDLPPERWEHWHLAALTAERALAYAGGLALARHPDDPDRRADTLRLLKEASERSVTSRLMTNPLQVTIMHMIVDVGGGVPPARWKLFDEYYRILTQREMAKRGALREALEENATLLRSIHERAGLVLHVDGEGRGGAGATFDRPRFERLVLGFLLEEGFEETDARRRVEGLTELALNRLVLLTAREEGRIGFDVRSLQEYMAAAAITSGEAVAIQERLTEIAGVSHWRNAFLIAASRCFSEGALHHLRPVACTIPRILEAQSEADRIARNGARIALDMYSDGLGADHPNSRRLLAQHAIEMLDLGPDNLDPRLVSLWRDGPTSRSCDPLLRERLASGASIGPLAAWQLSMMLVGLEVEGMLDLAEHAVPTDAERLASVLDAQMLPFASQTLVERIRDVLVAAPPSAFFSAEPAFLSTLRSLLNGVEPVDHAPIALLDIRVADERNRLDLRVLPEFEAGLSVRLISVDDGRYAALKSLATVSAGWAVLRAVGGFTRQPEPGILARTLRDIAANEDTLAAAHALEFILPWPIANALRWSPTSQDLQRTADRAAAGDLGDLPAWRAAEKRWLSNGISSADFEHAAQIGTCFDQEIGTVGLPPLVSFSVSHKGEASRALAVEVARRVLIITSADLRAQAIPLARWALLGLAPGSVADVGQARSIIDICLDEPRTHLFPDLFEVFAENVWADEEFADAIARCAPRCLGRGSTPEAIPAQTVIDTFLRAPERRRGLLYPLAVWLCNAQATNVSILESIDCRLLAAQKGDEPVIRSAGALIRYASGAPAEEVAAELCSEGGTRMGLHLTQDLITHDVMSPDRREELAVAIVKALAGRGVDVSRLRRALKTALDERRTRLASEVDWRRLKLPETAFGALLI